MTVPVGGRDAVAELNTDATDVAQVMRRIMDGVPSDPPQIDGCAVDDDALIPLIDAGFSQLVSQQTTFRFDRRQRRLDIDHPCFARKRRLGRRAQVGHRARSTRSPPGTAWRTALREHGRCIPRSTTDPSRACLQQHWVGAGDHLAPQRRNDRQRREDVTVCPTIAVEPAFVTPLDLHRSSLPVHTAAPLDRSVKFRSNGPMDWPLRFGIFMAPFHPPGQNPTLALERDLDLIVHLDQLGFDEAWIGEHHSGGYEIIASPEVFIATAAERTRNIRLGTGVVSLPYHQPVHGRASASCCSTT